jgi:hypothetical protein
MNLFYTYHFFTMNSRRRKNNTLIENDSVQYLQRMGNNWKNMTISTSIHPVNNSMIINMNKIRDIKYSY